MRVSLSSVSDGLTPYVTAGIVSCTDMEGNPISGCASFYDGTGQGFSSGQIAQPGSGGSFITTGQGKSNGLIPGVPGLGLFGFGNLPGISSLIVLGLLAGVVIAAGGRR